MQSLRVKTTALTSVARFHAIYNVYPWFSKEVSIKIWIVL